MNPSPELIFWAGFAVGTALSAFAVVVSGVAKVFAFLDRDAAGAPGFTEEDAEREDDTPPHQA